MLFWYESDEEEVIEVARGLRYWVDKATEEGWLGEGSFVILAHSMGGLVSRAFMDKTSLTKGTPWTGKIAGGNE